MSSTAKASGIEHAEDIKIESCERDSTTGWVHADITVTNNSSKPSNYMVTVGILSADKATKYDDALASISTLAPGQSSPQTAQSLKSDIPDGFICELSNVTRYAS